MTTSGSCGLDTRLHDTAVMLVLEHGPQDITWLARRARRELKDARVDEQSVIDVVEPSTILVPRPSGMIDHALSVLNGNVLTHRVRAPLAGRSDLWLGPGVQPLLNFATCSGIPLADGSGIVTRAETGLDVLCGPQGWLPDVERHGLIGLRIIDGHLDVSPVDESELASPEDQLWVRELLADRYTRERYWYDVDQSLSVRPAEVARAINLALLEVPDLFARPYPPLDELLHDPLERNRDLAIWREIGTSHQIESAGFYLDGVPTALDHELQARATQYGMAKPQFIVALLSMLAWRTPFGEDMEPWENWLPRDTATVATLRPVDNES